MPKAKWWYMLQASKEEALLAVDLYNRPAGHRNYEGFVVHMHLAWLYQLHALFRRDGIDYRYRHPNRRFVRVDGEPKTWELQRCVEERWPTGDPVRANLEFFIAIRNKIEHRFAEAFAIATGGHAQALILNYERHLIDEFRTAESLGQQLRFPVFVGSLTQQGEQALKAARNQLPRQADGFMADFHAGLDPAVAADERFEFRVHLVPMLAKDGQADLAVKFVRLDDLSDGERNVLEDLGKTGRVIVRDQQRPVSNADKFKPRQAVEQIGAGLPFRFNMAHFVKSYKKLAVRPPKGDTHPERTDERYCTWDAAHKDYVYTQAFIKKVVREVSAEENFRAFLGQDPVPKADSAKTDE